MNVMRRWSVRNARFLEWIYGLFEPAFAALHPVYTRIGYGRLEAPVSWTERVVKGFLFDCRMCGHCVLSQTGMSCPMNCPKQLRNGPCGGVRESGNCEVSPDMRCVWVDAWEGSRRMRAGAGIATVQVAVDFSRAGASSWLHRARERAGVAGP
jgi:hypothetical protein